MPKVSMLRVEKQKKTKTESPYWKKFLRLEKRREQGMLLRPNECYCAKTECHCCKRKELVEEVTGLTGCQLCDNPVANPFQCTELLFCYSKLPD
jgi:hypothetical protein